LLDDCNQLGVHVRTMQWPSNGQYVLISPNGDMSANPVNGGDGSLIFGNVSAGPESLWASYPYKAAHAKKYSS
jgi:hypothetical protein